MKKGKIIEEGTHETLLENYPEGTYANFVSAQEQGNEEEGFVDQMEDNEDDF